jgi:hypothetical protein
VLDVRGRSRGERKAVAKSFHFFCLSLSREKAYFGFILPREISVSRECIGKTLFIHLSWRPVWLVPGPGCVKKSQCFPDFVALEVQQ